MKDLRVLLVDDDRVTGLTMQHYFNENVAHFQSVGNAETAITILEDNPSWDVVISDYVLPEMDGGTFLKKAKEIQPNLKTILITSYDPQDIDSVLQKTTLTISYPNPFQSTLYTMPWRRSIHVRNYLKTGYRPDFGVGHSAPILKIPVCSLAAGDTWPP